MAVKRENFWIPGQARNDESVRLLRPPGQARAKGAPRNDRIELFYNYLINYPVFDRFVRAHKMIAVSIFFNHADRLACMFG